MRTILILLALVAVSSAFALGIGVPNGKEVSLPISNEKIKAITRVLKNGKKQTWNVDGPNKGTWVDEAGKKIPSSNYSFKAPGTLVIKKATKADAGLYDYVPLVKIVEEKLPPGVHVDPVQQGIELDIV